MMRTAVGTRDRVDTARRTAAAPGTPGRRSGTFVLLTAGFAAAIVAAGAAPAAGQFSATPVIVELEPGAEGETAAIRVRNEGESALPLRFYAGDFEQDSLGQHRFMEPGEHARSCADRLHLFPESLTLDGGEQAEVMVRLEPGARSCWSVVFAESTSRSTGGLSVAQRIAVKIYGSREDGARAAEVESVVVDGGRVALAVSNTGDRPFVATGDLEVRSLEGVVVATAPIEAFSVLPDRHRSVLVQVPAGLEPGEYLAIPIVDFGGDYLAGGQALFTVPTPEP